MADALSFLDKRKTAVFWMLVSLITVIYLASAVLAINKKPLAYDEGWILQAPYSLVHYGHYASFGGMFDSQEKIFDPYLSTGPAVTLPIALVFKVFGCGVVQARLVMIFYHLAAIFLISWYVFRRNRSIYSIIAPLLLLLVVSELINFRFDVLGEIPAIAFGLGSLLAFRSKRYFISGLCAAGAILSKSIMLFLLPAGVLILLIPLLRRRSYIKNRFRSIAMWITGIGIPLVGWELFKFIQLGSSWSAYKHNWREYIDVFKVGGSGFSPNGTILSFSDKYHMVLSAIDLTQAWIVVAVALLLILIFIKRAGLMASLWENSYGLVFLGIYAVWWFAIANGGFVRYVVPLVGILIAVLLEISLAPTRQGKVKKIALTYLTQLFLLLILFISVAGFYHNYLPLKETYSPYNLSTQEDVAARINQTTHNNLTHLGWWQNPEIMFLGNLRTTGEQYRSTGRSYQLLISPTMASQAPSDYAKGRAKCKIIYFDEAGYIYCQVVKND